MPLTHAHTYRHVHIYTCKHALTLHAHTHASMHSYCMHTHTHTHVRMHARTHTQTCTYTRTHVIMHVCTHARTHARTHAHTHACMYTHTCTYQVCTCTHHKDFIYWSSQATKRVWRPISHKRAPVNGGIFVRLQRAHVTLHTSYFDLGLGKAFQEQEEVDRLTVVWIVESMGKTTLSFFRTHRRDYFVIW